MHDYGFRSERERELKMNNKNLNFIEWKKEKQLCYPERRRKQRKDKKPQLQRQEKNE